ncbi:hypothetical protein HK103_000445 [Boothiomyces macroporosus]|uniref:Uncharacterized protein n=1 Tax=Boothiomyces macroporosus TaxID=261099 RepID=A0AAD5Y154_9FUNG|nr:hypothetical protein HK103_000445 [Boothiomyces macroporosus]
MAVYFLKSLFHEPQFLLQEYQMQARKPTTPEACFWILTIPYQHWEKPETIEALAGVQYIRGQLEHSSQCLYWQLAVQYFEPVSFVKVKELFSERAHVEMSYTSVSWDYAWKDEIAIAETRFELGDNSILLNRRKRKRSLVDHHKPVPEWLDIDKMKTKLETAIENLYFLPKEGLYHLWKSANDVEELIDSESSISVWSTSTENLEPKIQTPQKSQATNKGKFWKAQDIEELNGMLRQDFSIQDIANHFKRTSKGIIAKAASMVHSLLESGMTMDVALKVFNNKISERDMIVYYNYQIQDKANLEKKRPFDLE